MQDGDALDQSSPQEPDAAGIGAQPRRTTGLVLVSTPIGNLGDMTIRGLEILRQADLILCEDTRTTARLLGLHSITTRTEALHDHNEEQRIPGLIERLRRGALIALVSDAGTPLVSDPGYRLARAAIAEGLPVTATPGANAALLALTLSGLPPHPFLFLGFPPPRESARQAHFTQLRAAEQAGLSATMIWYEAPHRLAEMLADLALIFGPREAAVARELTKRFEEIRRAPLDALAAHYAHHAPRGEIVVLIGPAPDEVRSETDIDALLTAALESMSVKDAAAAVAAATGVAKKQLYARAIQLRGQSSAE